jgi:hypothetical protein
MLIGDKRWQRWLSLGGLVVIIGSCFWMPKAVQTEAQAQPTAIVTPVHVPSTPTPVSLPAPTGEAIRVNFPLGSYGTALFGRGSQKYLLWAKAGQKWSLYQIGKGYSNLTGPDGKPLYQEAGAGMTITTTLSATGDQILEIRSSGQFTVGVEIR